VKYWEIDLPVFHWRSRSVEIDKDYEQSLPQYRQAECQACFGLPAGTGVRNPRAQKKASAVGWGERI
jgi:hypothetical protein